ncbi:MAG: bifunctional oligoribonuclease/PAP phosphatase NrnA [Candidatus Omnitrophica bacterium]|nr:bifunctional oligoribonuclease/PAP phosphatase NrnA [Candidatus Omnitrophota bacterium]
MKGKGMRKEFIKVRKGITRARSILVACHRNPDGDAIGSMLALGLGLKKIGKKVSMLCVDPLPYSYRKLPGASDVIRHSKSRYDCAIAVDCGKKDVLETAYKHFENAKTTIEIDHHDSREPFAAIKYVDTEAAAVGEIVYDLLRRLRIAIDKNIAENILTSIIVESNSFRLPSVRPETFRICADLVDKGVNFNRVTHTVYWARSRKMVLLSSLCLSRCVFLKNGALAWSIVKRSDFRTYRGKKEDIDAVADDMRAIEGVKIAILFREEEKGKLRVCLRSKHGVNIAALARKYGGGGHFDVAGCVIKKRGHIQRRLIADAKRLLS